ncbi:MAG TPA: 16S rRNA (adenine(1518)-N(6)/adenine(1519)-N(6))-dimethyltransferase RsmA [Actinomycetota bacterium]|nr:16S rRNA (adenine(1518)-N(6)/adenine(1519)-N(6))-dimethyltransferase RsmA [Actinomycetota bacterium]
MLKHVTPSIAADMLRRHRLRAGRRYGQHFLVDANTVRKIVRLARVASDDAVLEIGPGLGSLTVVLSETARRVVAVEIDEQVAAALREVTGDLRNVELVVADAMRADISALVGEPVRLVANLPYNVATPLLLRILDEVPEVTGGLVMVQKELGERWTAAPGGRAYGAATVHVAFRAEARVVGDVPATVFLPPPDVSSVLVEFVRRDSPPVDVSDPEAFFRFVRSAFGHRRKTLRNSLGAGGYARDAVEAALGACRLDARARPEDLSLEDFARLHAVLGDGAAA